MAEIIIHVAIDENGNYAAAGESKDSNVKDTIDTIMETLIDNSDSISQIKRYTVVFDLPVPEPEKVKATVKITEAEQETVVEAIAFDPTKE